MSWSEATPAQPGSTCSVDVMGDDEAMSEEDVTGEGDATEIPGATFLPLRGA